MDEKPDILRCLVENRVFAPSASALAKELGYKGKMTIYRLLEGNVKERTADEIWSKVQECYCVSDAALYSLARILKGAKYMSDALLPETDRSHPKWVENLILDFANDFYDQFSPEFQEEEAPFLKDLRKDEPDIFWGLVTMVYIRYKKIDLYQGDTKLNFCRLIEALDELLSSFYPEKADAHEASFNLKKLETTPNLWKALINCIILFRRYTEPDFAQNASQCMRLFPWGKRSFWHTPGCPYREGSEVWLLTEQDFGRASNGYYMVLRLEAGRDIHTMKLKDALVFSFWTIDNEDDPPILQVCRGAGTRREWCYYVYGYEEGTEGKRRLSLEANPETGNLFDLPAALQMIDLDHPEGKDEKVWARVLRMWEEAQGAAVFKDAKEMLSDRKEMDHEYHIEDVLISRNKFTLIVDRQGETVKYELPVEAYDFLSEISPSQTILIVKHTDDNEIYVEWPNLGYSIPLTEFATDYSNRIMQI